MQTSEQLLSEIIAGIKDDETWLDDWCPVCQEHPSHDHGGKDCPLVRAIKFLERGRESD